MFLQENGRGTFFGWWYQNDDGSFPKNSWKWIDGNHDGVSGILQVGTVIQGYQVNLYILRIIFRGNNGKWLTGGMVM